MIWCVLATGCRWEDVPPEMDCSGRTAHRRSWDWENTGVWDHLHVDRLKRLRRAGELEHQTVIVEACRCGRSGRRLHWPQSREPRETRVETHGPGGSPWDSSVHPDRRRRRQRSHADLAKAAFAGGAAVRNGQENSPEISAGAATSQRVGGAADASHADGSFCGGMRRSVRAAFGSLTTAWRQASLALAAGAVQDALRLLLGASGKLWLPPGRMRR